MSFCRFGFIRFDDIESATKALKKLNYSEVDGREIELRYAEERGTTPGGGRGRGGGGRGRGRGKCYWKAYFVCHKFFLQVVVVSPLQRHPTRELFRSSRVKRFLLMPTLINTTIQRIQKSVMWDNVNRYYF